MTVGPLDYEITEREEIRAFAGWVRDDLREGTLPCINAWQMSGAVQTLEREELETLTVRLTEALDKVRDVQRDLDFWDDRPDRANEIAGKLAEALGYDPEYFRQSRGRRCEEHSREADEAEAVPERPAQREDVLEY